MAAYVEGVPLIEQQRFADCGAVAMAMVASFWNRPAAKVAEAP